MAAPAPGEHNMLRAVALTFFCLTTDAAPAAAENVAQTSSCLLQAQHNRAARNGTVLENDEVPPEYSENRRGQRALVALRSQACQAFYQLPVASGGSLVWDESAHLFRHKAEMPTNYFGPELPYASFRRMLTYEDVAVKPNFSRATEPCQAPGCRDVFESLDYCLPYAVHGAQRPIKVNYLEVGSEKSLLAAAVWKCASTSLTDALWKVSNTTRFMGPHWKNLSAQHQAERLLRDFPGQWRSCEHATQSYFLSATDLLGNPIAWDFLLEVDNFNRDLQELSRLTQIDIQEKEEKNSSGDSKLKQLYFDAIFADTKTICAVCKVYAQDFTCLGYEFPDGNWRCENCSILATRYFKIRLIGRPGSSALGYEIQLAGDRSFQTMMVAAPPKQLLAVLPRAKSLWLQDRGQTFKPGMKHCEMPLSLLRSTTASTLGGRPAIDDFQIVIGGWNDAKRGDIEAEIRNLFELNQASPLLHNIHVPFVRSKFARVELLYTGGNLTERRKVQSLVIEALKKTFRDFKSNISGQESRTLWVTRNRSKEDREKIRALVSIKDWAFKHTSAILIDLDWRGKLWIRGEQVLYWHQFRRPDEGAMMLTNAAGDETGWWVDVRQLSRILAIPVDQVRDELLD
ncbi:hypothetical protein AK812_SmicGene27317 [Symbiodinium microadriaticum]|uniref:Uncharacterized protein n=1 Tax=Symbiodinium microadriaticum TaxID=2951 RepID=A0A1Q9D778_SYMMI|nr:hypothetical protein AK812_SmicGene27317 [Symbiodinium microadriaticum]